MSIRTALKQAAKQPYLEDLLMGDVDLDLMFGLDSQGDDETDDLQLQPQFSRPTSPPYGRH